MMQSFPILSKLTVSGSQYPHPETIKVKFGNEQQISSTLHVALMGASIFWRQIEIVYVVGI